MKQALLVFLGGGLGSVLRYYIGKTLNPFFEQFFLGTFVVNVAGCLLIGLVLGLNTKGNTLTPNQSLLLATGFCGGFTTFSTFIHEKYSLWEAGQIVQPTIYLITSVVTGILALMLGLWLSRYFSL